MKYFIIFVVAALKFICVQSLIGPRNLARFEIKTINNTQQCHQVQCMKPLFAAINSSSTMDAYVFMSDAERRLRYEQVSAFNSLKQSLDSYADRVKDEKSEKQFIDLKNQIVDVKLDVDLKLQEMVLSMKEQNEKTDKQFIDVKSELFILKALMVVIGAIVISLQSKVSDIISFLFSCQKLLAARK